MRNERPFRMITVMKTDITPTTPSTGSTAWARISAAIYDPFVGAGERAGMRALRKELVGRARGCTVEIGGGTGLNVPHYPDDLDKLIVVEPDPAMRVRLQSRVSRRGGHTRVVDGCAERLPFGDESVDTVVSTLVLCTVDEPDLALREIVRVLRPGGQLLFIEHVRADSPRLARWQDRLAGPWRGFARGCRCNRATAESIATCGLAIDDMHEASWRAMPAIVRPLVVGRARIGARRD